MRLGARAEAAPVSGQGTNAEDNRAPVNDPGDNEIRARRQLDRAGEDRDQRGDREAEARNHREQVDPVGVRRRPRRCRAPGSRRRSPGPRHWRGPAAYDRVHDDRSEKERSRVSQGASGRRRKGHLRIDGRHRLDPCQRLRQSGSNGRLEAHVRVIELQSSAGSRLSSSANISSVAEVLSGRMTLVSGAERVAIADMLVAQTARIRRAGRRYSGRPVELASLTSAQLELVRVLRRRPACRSPTPRRSSGWQPNTVSTLVGSSPTDGLIVRRVDPADRRVARLDLARRDPPQGRRVAGPARGRACRRDRTAGAGRAGRS